MQSGTLMIPEVVVLIRGISRMDVQEGRMRDWAVQRSRSRCRHSVAGDGMPTTAEQVLLAGLADGMSTARYGTDYAPAHILCLGSPTRVELQGRGPYCVRMSITLDAVRSLVSSRANRLFGQWTGALACRMSEEC